MSELFGFPADENGDVNFMTVTLETPVTCFAEYMEVFSTLVQLAIDNQVMPIIKFDETEY